MTSQPPDLTPSATLPALRPLSQLRRRLLGWQALTMLVILLALGAGLHLVLRRELTNRVTGAVAEAIDDALITAFGGAAVVAVVLAVLGGSFLVQKSTLPIERAVAHMRRFMADAAHELRTPIAVARARAEVALQQTRDPAEYIAALTAIENEMQRLGGVVGQLLLLARAETGELPLAREPVFLDDLALEAVQAARTLADEKGVSLTVSTFDEAPLVGDPGLLRQLVMILLDNSVKFTPAGHTVSVQVTNAGERAELEVADSGIGIEPKHLPHIFERFYRADSARGRGAGDGAGLGLAIARWIVEQHGGDINVTSQPGQGTNVRVRLPVTIHAPA